MILLLVILLGVFLFLIAPNLKRNDLSSLMGHDYAHRGLFDNGGGVLENTMPAFMLAAEQGHGIELDVQLSRDEVPMVVHDETLARLHHVDRPVWALDRKDMPFLPTLQEVLKNINGKVPVLVELKSYDRIYLLCEKAQAVLLSYGGAYAVQSFHPMMLKWFRKNAPKVPRGQLVEKSWQLIVNALSRPDFAACRLGAEKEIVFHIFTRVYQPVTIAWTVKTSAEQRVAQTCYNLQIFEQTP